MKATGILYTYIRFVDVGRRFFPRDLHVVFVLLSWYEMHATLLYYYIHHHNNMLCAVLCTAKLCARSLNINTTGFCVFGRFVLTAYVSNPFCLFGFLFFLQLLVPRWSSPKSAAPKTIAWQSRGNRRRLRTLKVTCWNWTTGTAEISGLVS